LRQLPAVARDHGQFQHAEETQAPGAVAGFHVLGKRDLPGFQQRFGCGSASEQSAEQQREEKI
jgi:hypothetical protein